MSSADAAREAQHQHQPHRRPHPQAASDLEADGQNHADDSFTGNEALLRVRCSSRCSGGSPARSVSRTNASDSGEGWMHRLKVAFYFGFWYALNILYNISNKKVLNVLPLPLTVASIQLGIGALYVCCIWFLQIRPTPRLTPGGMQIVKRVGVCHMSGQILTVTALGAGTVSFAHIVKASEPFFSAAVSAIVIQKWMKPQVYATLLPVVGGVAYACLNDASFSLTSLLAGLGSNVAFALRAVYSKAGMEEYIGDNVTAANLYGAVTLVSFLLSLLPALVFELTSIPGLWSEALRSVSTMALVWRILVSGVTHYTNNEVMYLALSNVHPVTLAVGNTMKRVFLLIASVVVFHTPLSLQAGIGSAVGISGVLTYSLARQHYENSSKQPNKQPRGPRR
jgi:solute carrier family 35 protein E1